MEPLSHEIFRQSIAELEAHYRRELSDFVKAAWYGHLQYRCTNKQFANAIKSIFATRKYMPTAAQEFLEIVNADKQENWQAYRVVNFADVKALPSTEINVEGLTEDERLANIRKVWEEAQRFKREKRQQYETEAPKDNKLQIFEAMRQLLHSDDEKNILQVLEWGKKNRNNVRFIFANDGDVYPIDMVWDATDEEAAQQAAPLPNKLIELNLTSIKSTLTNVKNGFVMVDKVTYQPDSEDIPF